MDFMKDAQSKSLSAFQLPPIDEATLQSTRGTDAAMSEGIRALRALASSRGIIVPERPKFLPFKCRSCGLFSFGFKCHECSAVRVASPESLRHALDEPAS